VRQYITLSHKTKAVAISCKFLRFIFYALYFDVLSFLDYDRRLIVPGIIGLLGIMKEDVGESQTSDLYNNG
jgi:hypothetical protein